MTASRQAGSPRRDELLEAAFAYVGEHGVSELSLRPLAAAIGSSPRVLLYLFGSKDGLVRALLERARADELDALAAITAGELGEVTLQLWAWLADPRHRGLPALWVDAYARSLLDPAGPWAEFAVHTVDDWLGVLATAQPARRRRTAAGAAERTAALSVLRGAMLDLLATGDETRTTAAVRAFVASLGD